VLLIVGVNGAGKTTTIGKLAHRLSKEGARVSCRGDEMAERVTGAPAGIAARR
jgi:fused signal recognition particle receptor